MLNLFMNAVADARLAPEAAYCMACIFLIFFRGGRLPADPGGYYEIF